MAGAGSVIDTVGGGVLEGHVAVMARADPGAFERLARGGVEIPRCRIDGRVLPGLGMARLAAEAA